MQYHPRVVANDHENRSRRRRAVVVRTSFWPTLLRRLQARLRGSLTSTSAAVSVAAPFLSVLNYFIDVSTVGSVCPTTDRLKLGRRGRGGVGGNGNRGTGRQTRKGQFGEGRTTTSGRLGEFPTAIVEDIRYEDGPRTEGRRYSAGRRFSPAARQATSLHAVMITG